MTNNTNRILIIEDNRAIWKAVKEIFRADQSYTFTCVENGDQGSDLLHEEVFDLAIIDLTLPPDGMQGRDIIREAQKDGIKTPILVLTANNDSYSESDNINDGANDYVTKPFKNHVLESRIRSLIRKSVTTTDPFVPFGKYTFHTTSNTVSGEGFEPFKLKNIPARILEVMVRSRAKVVESGKIARDVWGGDGNVPEKTINRNVNRVNDAFREHGLERIINRITGTGYELTVE